MNEALALGVDPGTKTSVHDWYVHYQPTARNRSIWLLPLAAQNAAI